MDDPRRHELMSALREHERQIEKLSRTLAELEPAAAWVTAAQLTRHRISLALLASQLDSSASAAPPAGASPPARWWQAASRGHRRSRG